MSPHHITPEVLAIAAGIVVIAAFLGACFYATVKRAFIAARVKKFASDPSDYGLVTVSFWFTILLLLLVGINIWLHGRV